MNLSDFDFTLPPDLIAQEGLAVRDQARMLVVRPSGPFEHGGVRDLLNHFSRGDVVVINDTRVSRARLIGRKETGGKADCLIVSDLNSGEEKDVLLRGKAFKTGSTLTFEGPDGVTLSAKITQWLGGAKYKAMFSDASLIERCARLPLPPYIKKNLSEETRYQTVYAKQEGSLAAPTAGLHFTPQLMQELKDKGVVFAPVTLHVGLGTFAPIRTENLEEVELHTEYFSVNPETRNVINLALKEKRRIFAVGTTSVRCLESAMDGSWEGWTRLFIYPGYKFKMPWAGMLTNFHLPKSSLLLLVAALTGWERILPAYLEAIERKYRFYSLGDAMLILRGI
ncbi:MAG: tRNA preQ1(34) S-adenosylmethionine ribosyltransferase-isomerase QueA [Elusimicrobia bacterium RIFCSPLOWO2_01_FULL_54_10]|nr:MAG: tRNA preQ1(34) S-adenosylmethionine ribosyltransferase-isomerase QueA [Elusimicrobia bacterium RIFCSPLOWO2_01_FULL_54_10]